MKRQKGMTLTEVLITITVSGILFSIIAVIISSYRSIYERSRKNNLTLQEVNAVFDDLEIIIEYANLNNQTLILIEDDEAKGIYGEAVFWECRGSVISTSFDEEKSVKYLDSIELKNHNSCGVFVKIITENGISYSRYFSIINLGGV